MVDRILGPRALLKLINVPSFIHIRQWKSGQDQEEKRWGRRRIFEINTNNTNAILKLIYIQISALYKFHTVFALPIHQITRKIVVYQSFTNMKQFLFHLQM